VSFCIALGQLSILTGMGSVVYSGQEAVLPLHLQAAWGFSSAQAGLAYIAAVVPTFLGMLSSLVLVSDKLSHRYISTALDWMVGR
jgi:hypothetical protein